MGPSPHMARSAPNPDGLPPRRLLRRPAFLTHKGVPIRVDDSLAIEIVQIDGRTFWLPSFYAERDELIVDCPKCPSIAQRLVGATLDDWYEAHEAHVSQIIASGRSPWQDRDDE